MFKKIKWKDHNFYYTFDKDEPVFDTNYFQFFNGNSTGDFDGDIYYYENSSLDYKIKVISSNELMVEGPFYEGYYVVINNIPYPYFEGSKPEEPKPEAPDEQLAEPTGIYQLIEDDNSFYFDKLPDDYEKEYVEVKVVVDEYTNEVYPDYPFRSKIYNIKLNKFHKVELFKKERNIIYHIFVNAEDGKKYFLKYISKILCYFSNVKSLKDYIKNLELNIPLKPDDELKLLIQENSLRLKRRFGLKEIYTENPEYFPIFKKVVNLYCIENLMSISFINGNFISTGEHGTNNGMKLSKFSIDGDGGSNGYALSTDLIENLINEAENDLYKSLFKEPRRKKKKGMFDNLCYQY